MDDDVDPNSDAGQKGTTDGPAAKTQKQIELPMTETLGKVKYVSVAAKSYIQRLADDGKWKSIWNATFVGHAEVTQAVYAGGIDSEGGSG